ncbi:hypothetical protein SUGI_0282430 [Cryptomeria japonica]|nr:hypothetical protein SUGI_0282430 [Cryptomeria japonica]
MPAIFGVHHLIADIFLAAIVKESKTGHLTPCARFTMNLNATETEDFRMAHWMHQWWATDLRIKRTECRLHPEHLTGLDQETGVT